MNARDEERTFEALEAVRRTGTLDESTPSGGLMLQRLLDKGFVEFDPDSIRILVTSHGHSALERRAAPTGQVIVGRFPTREGRDGSGTPGREES